MGNVELILFTRSDCHLCDVAKEELERLRRRLDFDLVERDVDGDPVLEDAYGDQVPVGVLGGRKIFKHRVDAAALERALRARAG